VAKLKDVSGATIPPGLSNEAAGAVALLGTSVIAFVLANSPFAPGYFELLHRIHLGLSLAHWVNDGLMTLFFLVIGLQFKREWLVGHLATREKRALPGCAALGGMVLPALIFWGFNHSPNETPFLMAIPTATDLAFALAVLSLLGDRVPASLKVFLLAIAILEDIGGVMIVAFIHTQHFFVPMLLAPLLLLSLLIALNRKGITRLRPYIVTAVFLWMALGLSGFNPTLAGLVLALSLPLGKPDTSSSSASRTVEEKLIPYVTFLILPIFGFTNAGVSLLGMSLQDVSAPVTTGVATGLLIGKPLGLFAVSGLVVALGLAKLPENCNWVQLYGVAALSGIGFTASLWIGAQTIPAPSQTMTDVKIAVLMGSVLSALLGVLILRSGVADSVSRILHSTCALTQK
jgi:NhaA family Na+:H+ antiporter